MGNLIKIFCSKMSKTTTSPDDAYSAKTSPQGQRNYFMFSLKGMCIILTLSVIISNLSSFHEFNKLTYAIYREPGSSFLTTEMHLAHVTNVLERIGFRKVDYEENWDLLWANEYPFEDDIKIRLQNLNRSVKINHVPGCEYLISKVDLSTSGLTYMPKAFRLPEEKEAFLSYQKSNPNMLFVEKDNKHRYITIKSSTEIDLNSEKNFVQEFIEEPYLVDGYKFDIGVYVVITSLNPLRVYIYTGDYAFRFCPEKYYPFDPTNVDKYIVADNYLPMWEIPSLQRYYSTFKFSFKDSFDAYVQKQNQDHKVIWNQIEEILRNTILAKENDLLIAKTNYKGRYFFEMMRFDLIVQQDLKVYLMEANMSPNLSSAHHKQNAVYFEQIIYNVMQVLGIGSSINRNKFETQQQNIESMISSEKNIAIDANACLNNHCDVNCNNSACSFCVNCMNQDDLEVLHETYREHIRRAETKRIFPKPITNLSEYNIDEEMKGLTPSNQMITKWFYEKCKIDSTWCT